MSDLNTPDTETAITLFRQNRSKYNADSTVERYEQGIREWLDYLQNPGSKSFDQNDLSRDSKRFWEATKHNLSRYLQFLLENGNYAPETVKLRKASISTFYQSMAEIADDDEIPYEIPETNNPAENITLTDWKRYKDGRSKKQQESDSTRKINYLTPAEVAELISNAPSPRPRNELIIKFLYHTGMRRSELSRVKLSDLFADERKITVDDQKNNQERVAFYPPELDTPISRWLNVHRKAVSHADSEYLFPTNRAEKISTSHINRIVKQSAENAGLQANVYTDASGQSRSKITAHTLRHSFAISCLQNDVGIRTIQELMGHAKVETTEIYLDVVEDTLEEQYRNYGTQKLPGSD